MIVQILWICSDDQGNTIKTSNLQFTPYNIQLTLQHPIDLTSSRWPYGIQMTLQHPIDLTASDWPYSIQLTLQHPICLTASNWPYSIQLTFPRFFPYCNHRSARPIPEATWERSQRCIYNLMNGCAEQSFGSGSGSGRNCRNVVLFFRPSYSISTANTII